MSACVCVHALGRSVSVMGKGMIKIEIMHAHCLNALLSFLIDVLYSVVVCVCRCVRVK